MYAENLFCFLCYFPLAGIRRDKLGRPYYKCEGCGARLFMRTERSVHRVCELIDAARANAVSVLGAQIQNAVMGPLVPSIQQVQQIQQTQVVVSPVPQAQGGV